MRKQNDVQSSDVLQTIVLEFQYRLFALALTMPMGFLYQSSDTQGHSIAADLKRNDDIERERRA